MGLRTPELTSVVSSPTVTSRLSRYSYGMAFSHPYDPKKHLIEDCYLDTSDGSYKAKDQMKWLLKRVRGSNLTCIPHKANVSKG